MSTLFDAKTLAEFKKPQLVEMILELQKEKNTLISQALDIAKIDERVTEQERSLNLYLQYGRRNSVEVTGIPAEVKQEDLEDHIIKIFDTAQVKVHGKSLDHMDIEAAHRIGKKNVVIARFVNRKFAREALYKSKNLKGTNIYGNQPIYINDSFCRPFQLIGYVVRQLKKRGIIQGFKIRNGVYSIKIGEKFEEISHKNDFNKFNIDIAQIVQ